MKISDLCKREVDGWDRMNFPGQMCFIHRDYGMSLHASVKEAGTLHVSIAPVRTLREDLSHEEHCFLMLEKTPEILTAFFDKRTFRRMPQSPMKPNANHYFSDIEN